MYRKPNLPHPNRCLRPLAAACVLAAAASPAAAVTYCVGTVAELQSAAATIRATETQFDLRIKSGYYAFTPVQGQSHGLYINRRFTTETAGGAPHRISGAWNSNCTQQASEISSATSTVLDAQGLTGAMAVDRLNWLSPGPSDLPTVQLVIDRLQLANSTTAGLRMTRANTTQVQYWRGIDVTVDRVRSELSAGSGISLWADGEVVVRNSVILGNTGFGSALDITSDVGPIHVYNNTMRYNRNQGGTGNAQVRLSTLGFNYFFNNLISDGVYATPAVDLRIVDGVTFVRNNRLVAAVAQDTQDLLVQSDNTPAVPMFINEQNPRLAPGSPLRDLGIAGNGPGIGSFDYEGDARVQGAAAELGAFELAPLTLLGPSLAYNPTAGASAGTGGPVNFTGVTTIGTTGSRNISVTPSGGIGSGTTTLSAFTLSGSDAGFFARTSASTLTFTAGNATAQNIALTCTSGSSQRSANLQATETIANGATSQRFWVLVCPAGTALGPTLSFNPAAGASAGTGGPVNFTGVTSAGSTGSGSIAVSSSGGAGGGITSLSSFTLSGTDAAFFTRTSASTLNFTAGTNTTQNITYTCTSGASQRSANLQATQVTNGGGTTQRFWVLVCPAGTSAGPTLSYNPTPGASAGFGGPVTFTDVTSAGSTGSGSIAVSSSGGAGSGNTNLSAFTLTGADAAFFTRTSASALNFGAGSNSTQNVTFTCTSGASERTANLQATEIISGGATTQRFWVLVCPAGTTSQNIFAGGFED